jgi:hypothetical protein
MDADSFGLPRQQQIEPGALMPDARLVAAASVALTVTLVAIFSLRPLAPRVGLVDS